jgi:hypothetical protein
MTVLVDFEGSPPPVLTDFGGNDSTVVDDPTGATNQVAQVVKSATAELWAGTTVSYCPNESIALLPFSATEQRMSLRVWSPDAGIPVRMKVEDADDGAVSVETEATTTVASQWETLIFDFGNQVAGTAPIDLAATYNKVSVFFNFGTTGADAGEKTYFMDDITFLDVVFSPDCPGGGGGDELTTNGDFEAGDLSDWTLFCATGTCEATMAQANGGSWSGRVVTTATPADPLIKQANIGIGTVTANSEVSISFDLYGSLTGDGGVVFAEFFSELSGGGTSKTEILGGGPLVPTAAWVPYSYTVTTGDDVSGGVTLQLKAGCGAVAGCVADAYFDNVSVTVTNP